MDNPNSSGKRSKEEQLVFASISVDEKENARIQEILHTDLDWTEIRKFAQRHQVIPLLVSRLDRLGWVHVPQEEREFLSNIYLTLSVKNLHQTNHLLQTLSLFDKHSIEILVLKGPSLAVQLYGDLSLRQFSDLDVLIREEDFNQTYDLLKMAGYRQSITLKSGKLKRLKTSGSDLHFLTNEYSIELHWGVADHLKLSPIKVQEFWERVENVQMLDQKISALPPDTLLLYLCHHGSNHQWSHLKWIADIAHLVKKYPEQDYELIRKKAISRGFRKSLDLGLILAEQVGGAILPDSTKNAIYMDPSVNRLAQQVINKSLETDYSPGRTSVALFFFRLRENYRDWAIYIRNLVFIPRQLDWKVVDLPDILYPLYFIIRPIRLLYSMSRRYFTTRPRKN
jgi:hypothetical protein